DPPTPTTLAPPPCPNPPTRGTHAPPLHDALPPPSATCSTNDNGTRHVKGEIRDKDGGVSSYSADVTVDNVAPTATFNNNGPVDRSEEHTSALHAPCNPFCLHTPDNIEYRFSCDNG